MNCKNAKRLLSNYLDGNLKSNSKKELELHLEGCNKCSRELASLQKLQKMLKSTTVEQPSPEYWEGFWSRISKRLEHEKVSLKAPLFERVKLGVDELRERLSYPFLLEPRVALNVVVIILLCFSLILFHQRGREISLLQERMIQAQKVQEETLQLVGSIGQLVHKLEDSYTKEEIANFMSCFSKEYFPDYGAFQKKISSSFKDSNNLDLNITITDIDVKDDTIEAKVVWTRKWDASSFQKGTEATIRMRRLMGDWKVTHIDDESPFVIGRGRLKTFIR